MKFESIPDSVTTRKMEKEDQPIEEVLSNLNVETIKAIEGPLNGVISRLTHVLNPLI